MARYARRDDTVKRAAFVLGVLLLASACAGAPTRARPAWVDSPPQEAGTFREPALVELVTLDPTIKLDVRYASARNFVGRPVYDQARVFLQRPAAEALVRAHRALRAQGYGLLLFDGYRPWRVTKLFWDVTPPDKRAFVADPAQGSRHNRGCAIDLTLYDLASGRELEMPSAYDEMSERAAADYAGGSVEARARREILREALAAEGFEMLSNEWWHFDYKDWRSYALLDIPFNEIAPRR
jgi:D-alanyl-D-alanine dipeptidase